MTNPTPSPEAYECIKCGKTGIGKRDACDCKPEARVDWEKAEKLVKNKIANVLHFYRCCKNPDDEIERMVDSLFELSAAFEKGREAR